MGLFELVEESFKCLLKNKLIKRIVKNLGVIILLIFNILISAKNTTQRKS